jgi:hypothetical protein
MWRKALVPLGIAVLATAASSTGRPASSARAGAPLDAVRTVPYATVARHRFVYPLKLSHNRRYLVDQRNVPFMIVGDAPQSVIGNLSVQEAAAYIADRRAGGFNALWINLLCAKYTGCRADGKTYDGIAPFTTPGDLSTPNPAYFARAAAILRLAARAGLVVFLDPSETGSWLSVLKNNGLAKDRAFGRFLGKRFRSFSNIVWLNGNDFQTWTHREDDAAVLAVAKGIRSADRAQLQTVELNYYASGSLDDSRWRPVIGLDAAYTYYPTYAQVIREYNRRSVVPVFMIEAGYEFEQNSSWMSYGDPVTLRRQEYWTALSGATGQIYGNGYIWPFRTGWKDHLDTIGSKELGYLVKLFVPRRWFRLVPDQHHKLVIAGYGRFSSSGNVGSSDYVTSAVTADRRLAVSYLPRGGSIAVNMSRLVGPRVHARWYDPTDGRYVPVPGSPFRTSDKVELQPPGENADGDPDWVLLLTT